MENINIPLSIFKNKKLSALEAIVKHMREELGLKIVEVAKLLNRNNKTIWATYNKAEQKMKDKLDVKSEVEIPVSVFRPRLLSILESLVEFLKEEKKMKLSEIASAINRDDRTVWTVYNRSVKKRSF